MRMSKFNGIVTSDFPHDVDSLRASELSRHFLFNASGFGNIPSYIHAAMGVQKRVSSNFLKKKKKKKKFFNFNFKISTIKYLILILKFLINHKF